jgi:hypothetical protein
MARKRMTKKVKARKVRKVRKEMKVSVDIGAHLMFVLYVIMI